MTICTKCGKSIEEVSRECPNCHTRIGVSTVTNEKLLYSHKFEYDAKNTNITLISMFIPFLGLILYLKDKEDMPLKASSALTGFLINIVLIMIYITIIVIGKLF